MRLKIPGSIVVTALACGGAGCSPANPGNDAAADDGGLAACRTLCEQSYGPQDRCGATCPTVVPTGGSCGMCLVDRPLGNATCCCCAVA